MFTQPTCECKTPTVKKIIAASGSFVCKYTWCTKCDKLIATGIVGDDSSLFPDAEADTYCKRGN